MSKRKRTSTTGTSDQCLIEFDPDGDLTLTVGPDGGRDMKVDSNALSRMSPVFHRMLKGNFAEARPSQGEWRVKLPEDNPEDFAIIMDMIHCQYELTPQTPTLNELYNILVITNKYDMARAVRPLAKKWIEPFVSGELPRDIDELESQLFVAWELGHVKQFARVTEHLVTKCRANDDGYFVNLKGQMLFRKNAQLDACGVKESLKASRLKRISKIREECSSLTMGLMKCSISCKAHRDWLDRPCHAGVLGIMLVTASSLNMTDFFLPSEAMLPVVTSLSNILKKLEAIETSVLRYRNREFYDCGFLGELLRSIRSKLNKDSKRDTVHMKFLKSQLAKTLVCSEGKEAEEEKEDL